MIPTAGDPRVSDTMRLAAHSTSWSLRPGFWPTHLWLPLAAAAMLPPYFFFLAARPRWRWLGLGIGLGAGIAFALAQQLRGAHFASHDLWAAAIGWFTALGLYWCLMLRKPADPATAPAMAHAH